METITLWSSEEYQYPAVCGFIPKLTMYLHKDGVARPCMLVVPGGGYAVVSPSEGEIVAKRFYEMGYQTAVVTYTTNLLMSEPLGKQPMKDLLRAIRYIRKNAKELCVLPQQMFLCGFSAGAHACASLGVHWSDQEDTGAYAGISGRPDAMILSYPVITSGEYAHRESFMALLGLEPTQEELEYMSLEKQVTEKTPPCFLWQTATDELVPVKNSYLFAAALQEKGIPYALHIFSEGTHGLSLADEAWANEEFGEPYTLEQAFCVGKAVMDGLLSVPEEVKQALAEQQALFTGQTERAKNPVYEEIKVWPELADQWIQNLMKKGK